MKDAIKFATEIFLATLGIMLGTGIGALIIATIITILIT
jgi:hypothetical protein